MIVDEIVNLNGTYVGPVSDINVRNVDNVTVVALDPLRWGTVEMTLYKIVGGREIEIGNPKLNATTTYQDNLSVSSAEFLRLKVTTADTSVDSADAGRNAALSFSWTWDSCPASGPAQLEMSSQPMATAIASHTPLRAADVRWVDLGAGALVSGARVLTGE